VEVLDQKEIARLLANNPINRNQSEGRIILLASQMPREWRVNGEPIIIGSDGRLLDGQHRLVAAQEAGCDLVTFVIRGVDPKDFHSINTGKSRTLGDVLSIKDEVNSSMLASALSVVYRYEHKGMLKSSQAVGFTHKRGLNLLRRNPELRDSVALINKSWARDLGLSSGHAALHHLYAGISRRKADDFFAQLTPDGHQAGKTNPPNVLVAWMLKHVVRAPRKPSPNEVLAVAVKCLRAHFEGRSLSRVGWVQTGSKAEDFPALTKKHESHGVRVKKIEGK
jgi:hypothetical protein